MKCLLYIIIALAAATLLYFGIFNREQSQPSNNPLRQSDSEASQQTEQPANTVQDNWDTKIDDQPPVTIKVTPVEFGKDTETWKFQVVFDTHSGSLDQDPTKVMSLTDDNGNTYQPSAWEGAGPGGHHREGVLIFNAINPVPLNVELKIKDVGGIAERSFRWDLE